MSFKSEASKVKANLAAGNYKEKTDVFAGFFDELTYGIKKQDEAKRQEELESKREKRANDREILRQQKEQDKLEQAQNRLANLYFTTSGQDKTAQNKSSVLSVIKDGGITNIANLNTLMSKTSSYTPGRTQQDIETQMSELQNDLSQDGALFNAAKEGVDQTTTGGTIEFGPQTKGFDVSVLRDNNWEGFYNQAIYNKDNATAERIQAWAVSKDFYKVAGGYTKKQLMAMPPISTDGKEVSLETILNTTKLNPTETNLVNGIKTVKEAETSNKDIFKNVDQLLEKDVNFLRAAGVVYTEDTNYGKNIAEALNIKVALESSNNLATLATTLEKDVSWYDNQIELNKNLDVNSPFYKDDLTSLASLITLRSMALEKSNADDLQAEVKLSTKERYLRAKYRELGFFVEKEGVVNIPDSSAMATIEAEWKKLTDISEQPKEWFTEEKLLSLKETELKVILDTGMLNDKPDVVNLIKGMLESRVNQAEDTQLSELLDSSGKSFKSTLEVDTFLASVGPDKMTVDALVDYARVRAVLAKQEGIIAEGEDINAYQMAFKEHLAKSENQKLQGEAFINMVTDWETTWKDNTSATKDFVQRQLFHSDGRKFKVTNAVDFTTAKALGFTEIEPAKLTDFGDIPLYLNGNKVVVRNLKDYNKQIALGYNEVQLGQISQIVKDLGVDRETAQKIKSGILQTGSDGFGRTVLIDKATGTVTQLKGQTNDTDTVNNSLTPAQVEERALAESEAIEALKKAGFEGQIDNLDDIAAAFGPESWVAKTVNTITGVFKSTGMPNSAEAVSTLNALGKVTKFNIISGFNGLRDSVSLKAEVETLIPKSGKFFTSELDALRNFKDIKAVLDQAIIGQRNIASEGTGITTTAESNANVALKSLEPLSGLYGDVIAAMEGEQKSNAAPIDSSIFVTSKKPNRKQIRFLKDNPETKDQFDAKFGAGSSSSILGDN